MPASSLKMILTSKFHYYWLCRPAFVRSNNNLDRWDVEFRRCNFFGFHLRRSKYEELDLRLEELPSLTFVLVNISGTLKMSLLCYSDDRAEEAEAADRPVGTASAHECQPPAACLRSACAPTHTDTHGLEHLRSGFVRLVGYAPCNLHLSVTVGERCNIHSHRSMCSSNHLNSNTHTHCSVLSSRN